jgi:uncharacterized protein YjbI with pentapeptide repeats
MWQELADAPFASTLTAHRGPLGPSAQYDGAHFDDLEFGQPDAGSSRFLECAFTKVSFQRGRLRGARFASVWLSDVQLVATGLAETEWLDAVVTRGAVGGVEAFGARMHRVEWRGCKLDSVNFRDAEFTDVTFRNCVLRDADFSGAKLTRVAFPGSRLADTDFTRVTMDKVDLRDAELGIVIDPGAMRGAIITAAQLTEMAPLLAESMGIEVKDR